MPIVSSEITHDDPQIDGRRYIHERHLDDQGREYIFVYLADVNWDAQASLDARVPPLNAQLAQEALDEFRNQPAIDPEGRK